MQTISPVRRRRDILAMAALLLALCLFAGGAQALNESMNTPAIVTEPSPMVAGSESSAAASGYETPIVVRTADQVDPAIHGTRVIWQDWRNNDWYPGKIGFESDGDIYSYDLVSHLERPEGASASDYGKFLPNDRDAVISDAGIFWVWAGRSDADINNEVRGRTLAGDPVNVTLVGEPGQRVINDLAIDGNRLVYVLSNVGGDYRVILYDTATRYVFTIRESPNEIRSPDISGDNIVWLEYNGYSWDMYRYNLLQGTARQFATSVGDRASLAIDGTNVVWSKESGGEYDLYYWDLRQTYPSGGAWLNASGDQMNPTISGDRVVWQDNRSGTWDIYMGSLSGDTVATVSTAVGDQTSPAVDGDRIVWQDNRNGNWDVYMFTVSSSAPVPVPTPAPLVIASPGTYSVVADGFDGTVTPIEIRSSDVVLDGMGHTIDGSGRPGSCGIRMTGPVSNVVVRNVRLVNWETGICADAVTDSAIETSEISHNLQGIALNDTRGVEVLNNNLSFNDVTGVAVTDAVNATLRANDVLRTGDAFSLSYYGGGFEEMYIHAIEVAGSTGTGIFDNDLGGDHGSINLMFSDSTRVTGNQITGRHCGILSLSTVDGSNNDAIVVNNVFRNWEALYGSLPNATWNTTPSPGPNIVGGPHIGGNFWANLEGTGFSETHPDVNGDGFCDEPFDNGWGGVDQLPLAPWSGPAIVAVPGGAALPTDTSGDYLYDDVNGNGRKDFADVVLFFNQMAWIADHEPMSLFDYNGNGRIDFADVVWLFNHL